MNPLRGMIRDLESLDATIQQFDPTYQVEAIKPKASLSPRVLGQPWRDEQDHFVHPPPKPQNHSPTAQIPSQLLVERALDKNDQRLLRLMTKRVSVALRGQRNNGTVRSDQGPGKTSFWKISD